MHAAQLEKRVKVKQMAKLDSLALPILQAVFRPLSLTCLKNSLHWIVLVSTKDTYNPQRSKTVPTYLKMQQKLAPLTLMYLKLKCHSSLYSSTVFFRIQKMHNAFLLTQKDYFESKFGMQTLSNRCSFLCVSMVARSRLSFLSYQRLVRLWRFQPGPGQVRWITFLSFQRQKFYPIFG